MKFNEMKNIINTFKHSLKSGLCTFKITFVCQLRDKERSYWIRFILLKNILEAIDKNLIYYFKLTWKKIKKTSLWKCYCFLFVSNKSIKSTCLSVPFQDDYKEKSTKRYKKSTALWQKTVEDLLFFWLGESEPQVILLILSSHDVSEKATTKTATVIDLNKQKRRGNTEKSQQLKSYKSRKQDLFTYPVEISIWLFEKLFKFVF